MKRILSFDGGGVRGIISLKIAARIEAIFRKEYGDPNLVLADVFDLFAGTSIGAVLATFLAWGLPVAEVENIFIKQCREMFSKNRIWRRVKAKYSAEIIASAFREHFRENDGMLSTLESKKLRKLLLVVMRNATTGSPWPISSNPKAAFNNPLRPDCNLKIPIWQLLRASTAAPSYFPPEEITLGNQKFLFVDGGITPYNNPTLLAVMMATLPCYNLNWPVGRDELHVTSIGTGELRSPLDKNIVNSIYLWDYLHFVIPGLIGTFAANQDMLCRVIGDCLHGSPLDAEIGCLDEPTLLRPDEQKFSYVRYNCPLKVDEYGKSFEPAQLALDNVNAIPRLSTAAEAYAATTVFYDHLRPRSRIPWM
jgi:hypothetical protein